MRVKYSSSPHGRLDLHVDSHGARPEVTPNNFATTWGEFPLCFVFMFLFLVIGPRPFPCGTLQTAAWSIECALKERGRHR